MKGCRPSTILRRVRAIKVYLPCGGAIPPPHGEKLFAWAGSSLIVGKNPPTMSEKSVEFAAAEAYVQSVGL
jgi:hypothetical protein